MANLLETQLQGLLPKFYRVNSRMLGDDLSLSDKAYNMRKYVMHQIYVSFLLQYMDLTQL